MFELTLGDAQPEKVFAKLDTSLKNFILGLEKGSDAADGLRASIAKAYSEAPINNFAKGVIDQTNKQAKLTAQVTEFSRKNAVILQQSKQIYDILAKTAKLEAMRKPSARRDAALDAQLKAQKEYNKALAESSAKVIKLRADAARLNEQNKVFLDLEKHAKGLGKEMSATVVKARKLQNALKTGVGGAAELAQLKRLTAQMKGLGAAQVRTTAATKSLNAVTGLARNVFDGMGRHISVYSQGLLGASAAIFALTAATRAAITAYTEFSDKLARAQAVMSATNKETEKMGKYARDVAKRTIFTATETGEALVQLGMAGLSSDQAIQALEPTLQVASIGMTDFGRAADIVTNIMHGFGLQASDTQRIVDVMAQAITSSNATLEQIGNTLSYAAPVAQAYGVSLEAIAASAEVLHNSGIKASRAGTGLRRTLMRLYNPTAAGAKAFERLGVSALDSAGKTRPLIDILEDMAKAIDAGRGGIRELADIVGVRASTAFVALVDSAKTGAQSIEEVDGTIKELSATTGLAVSDLRELYEANLDAAGSAKKMQETIEDTIGADWKKLISALTELGIQILEVFGDDIRSNIQYFTQYIVELTENEDRVRSLASAIELLGKSLAILIGLLTARLAAGGLLSLGKGLVDGVKGLQGTKAAAEGAAAGMSKATAEAGKLGSKFGSLGKVMKGGGGIGLALIAGTALYELAKALSPEFEQWTEELWNSEEATKALREATDQQVLSMQQVKAEYEALTQAMERSNEAWRSAETSGDKVEDLQQQLNLASQLLGTYARMNGATGAYAKEVEEAQKKVNSLTHKLEVATGRHAELTQEAIRLSEAANKIELGRSLDELLSKKAGLEDTIDRLEQLQATYRDMGAAPEAITQLDPALEQARAELEAVDSALHAVEATLHKVGQAGVAAATAIVEGQKSVFDEIHTLALAWLQDMQKLQKGEFIAGLSKEQATELRNNIESLSLHITELFDKGYRGKEIFERLSAAEQGAYIQAKQLGLSLKDLAKQQSHTTKSTESLTSVIHKQRMEFASMQKNMNDGLLPDKDIKSAQKRLKELNGSLSDAIAKWQKLTKEQTDVSRVKQAWAEVQSLFKERNDLADAIVKTEKELYGDVRKLEEKAEKMKEENDLLEISLKLHGETNKVREQAALVIAKQKLASIDFATATVAEVEVLERLVSVRQKLADEEKRREKIKAQEAESNEIEAQFKKVADTIEKSLTDALMRSFESGGDFAETFKDTLENLFKTLVLRPIIQAIVAPVQNTISGMFSGQASAGGGSSLLSGFGGNSTATGLNNAADFLGLGNNLFGGANFGYGLSGLAGGFLGNAIGGQSGGMLGSVGSTLGYGLATGSGAIGTALGSLGWAAGPVGAVAGAVIGGALGSLFEDDPEYGFQMQGPLGGAAFGYTDDLEQQAQDHIQRFIDAADQQLMTILTEAQIEAANTTLEDRGSGHVDFTWPMWAGQLVVDRYRDAFYDIDRVLSDELQELIQQAGSEGWNNEELIQAGNELIYRWKIMQELAAQFGDQLDETAISQIEEAAGGFEEFLAGFAVYQQNFGGLTAQVVAAKEDLEQQFQELNLVLPDSRDAFSDLVRGIDLSTEAGRRLYGQLIAMVPALDQFYEAMQPLTDLMEEVDDQLAGLMLSEFGQEMRSIAIWTEDAIRTARQYGASQAQLAQIQKVATEKVEWAIWNAQRMIEDLVGQLYGTPNQKAIESIDRQMQAEMELLQKRQDAAQDLYNTEMRRYQASIAAAERIADYLDSLAQGTLSPLTPKEKLDAAQAAYNETLAGAKAGDEADLSNITKRADELLKALQDYYASSPDYVLGFNKVNQDLEGLSDQLSKATEPTAPVTSSYSTSSTLSSLESQRNTLEQRESAAERALLAVDLSRTLGDLGLALDVSVWELMHQQGVSIHELAKDLGFNLNKIDAGFAKNLAAFAESLHVDIFDLATRMGVNIGLLGDIMAQTIEASLTGLSGLEGMDSALMSLRDAVTAADANSAIQAVGTILNQLPENERLKLSPYLQNIIATTTGTTVAVDGQDNWQRATAENISAYIGQLWNIALNTGKIWDNARSLNIGLGFPSYDIGTKSVPEDQLAMVHRGEKIIDPVSSDILERYGIKVQASNDPEYRDYSYSRGESETADEIRSLKAEVVQLRKELADQHNKSVQQRQTLSDREVDATEEATRRQATRSVKTKKVA
jgi:TP901 family phage tail tape measure protein